MLNSLRKELSKRLVSGLAHIHDIMPQIPQTLVSDFFFHFTYKHSIKTFYLLKLFLRVDSQIASDIGRRRNWNLSNAEWIYTCVLFNTLLITTLATSFFQQIDRISYHECRLFMHSQSKTKPGNEVKLNNHSDKWLKEPDAKI